MIISFTICSKVISGVQPSFCLAFVGSPKRVSTSVGLKYVGSTATIVLLVSVLMPFSLMPVPCQSMFMFS